MLTCTSRWSRRAVHISKMGRKDKASAPDRPVHPVLAREDLTGEVSNGAEKAYVLFWGHKGTSIVRCFSQWYPAVFAVHGETYKTAEQFMMAEKARLFGDAEVLQQIMHSETPREAKALGRRIRDFREEIWRQHRTDIVVNGTLAKFRQNEDMLQALLSTGTSVIVEASPSDQVWGIGMGAKHPHAKCPDKWKGENLLGFCLMCARDILSNG